MKVPHDREIHRPAVTRQLLYGVIGDENQPPAAAASGSSGSSGPGEASTGCRQYGL